MLISAQDYLKMEHETKDNQMSSHMLEYCTPVDLNGAYVPLHVTQASKGNNTDLNKAAENVRTRFGL